MNKSLVTGVVIGAAVVTAGAAVANFTFGSKNEASVEAPAVAAVIPENAQVIPEPVVEPVVETPKFADVLDVDTVTKTTRKPRQVCKDHVVTHTAPPKDENRIAGTVIGAVVGGVLGNQVGDGRGRKLATA